MKVLFLTKYPPQGASSRYRVYQYLPYLDAAGIEWSADSLMSVGLYELSQRDGNWLLRSLLMVWACLNRISWAWRSARYDMIYMQRECLPVGPPVMEWWFRRCGKVLVFDMDDALFIHKPNIRDKTWSRLKNAGRLPSILSHCHAAVVGNNWLSEQLEGLCSDIRVFEVAEDTKRYRPRVSDTSDHPGVTIGWLGSPSTEKYLHAIAPLLQSLATRFPAMRVLVVGGGNFQIDGVRLEHRAWSFESELTAIAEFDMGIMPLPDEHWSLGKCGGKARTYMAAGLPVVASRIGYNTTLIQHGENGLLAGSFEEWKQCLSALLGSKSLRLQLGKSARQTVLQDHALCKRGPEFADLLLDVWRVGAGQRGTG